jgi:hypothetical protein
LDPEAVNGKLGLEFRMIKPQLTRPLFETVSLATEKKE